MNQLEPRSQLSGRISHVLVIVCVAAFVGLRLLDKLGIVNWYTAIQILGLSHLGVFDHFWLFQFFTAPLLHASVVHLAFNMLALWTMGPGVQRMLGAKRYVMFSVACAFVGLTAAMLLDHDGRSIIFGYSSVIFGLLIAQATFFPDSQVVVFGFFPVRMKYAVVVLGAIELCLVAWPEDQCIAHAGHLFGAATAFVLLRLWKHDRAGALKGLLSKRILSTGRRRMRIRAVGRDVPREL